MKKLKEWEKVTLIVISVAFLATMLLVSIRFPNPTASQERTFRTIIAIMAAAFGAMIPGTLDVTFRGWLRAGGAMALFVLIYFFSPASLVSTPESPLAPLIRSVTRLQSTAASMDDGPLSTVERVKSEASGLAASIEAINNLSKPAYKIDQARYAAVAWLMAGDAAKSTNDQSRFALMSLEQSRRALVLLREAVAADPHLAENLRALKYEDKIRHMEMDANLLLLHSGNTNVADSARTAYEQMSETYRNNWIGDNYLAVSRRRYDSISALRGKL